MNCLRWLELLASYKAGESSQRSADQAASRQEIKDALQSRAATDDKVRGASDADAINGLSEWERPGPDAKP